MDDEVEMDASGCWVMKNVQLISETPLRSQSEQYNRLAYSLEARDTVNDDKQDDGLIIC
tara:strand:+ start:236 stop:412 length:177 start_codon:yes stop_codon:yes gene_type:complete